MECRLLSCYLVVAVAVVLVQSLPTPRQASLDDSDSPVERKVYWPNVSRDYPSTVQTLIERTTEEERVKRVIAAMRRSAMLAGSCQSSLSPGSSLLKDTSLCPWSYHTEDEDENRIPVMIPQAYCKCHFSRLANSQDDITSSCREVFENRQVLRRANSTSPYVPYDVSVSVACVCHKSHV